MHVAEVHRTSLGWLSASQPIWLLGGGFTIDPNWLLAAGLVTRRSNKTNPSLVSCVVCASLTGASLTVCFTLTNQ